MVELLQSQITKRDVPGFSEYAMSPGIYSWCKDMETCCLGFECMEAEDQEFCLADVHEEMQIHAAILNYCIEAFDELLEEERENERDERVIIARMVQQRLTASLAAGS